jgi:myb proto-oncogene protein
VKSIPWEEREDAMLRTLMDTDSRKKWTEIAIKLFEANVSKMLRTAKQVRERWVNYIDPSLKRQDWTRQEDEQLFEVVEKLGKKWSTVGKIFQRTENNVKNRYNSLINRPFRVEDYEEKDNQEEAKPRAEVRAIKFQEKMCGYR